MVVNKQVNFIKCLSVLLMNVSSSMADKFKTFYTKRIFDTDLAPSKTFSYNFVLGPENTSSHKRSLDKLKGLFNKHLAKVSPAIQLASTEFLPMGASSGFATLNLFNLYFGGETLPEVDQKAVVKALSQQGMSGSTFAPTKVSIRTNSTQEWIYFQSIAEIQSMHRYVRYLNYLARKNDVPVRLTLERDYIWEGDGGPASGKATVKICAQFQTWYCNHARDVERYLAVKAGAEDDALFSDVTKWSAMELDSQGKGHASHKFHIAKFFLHLDKITNVLNTLTRKVEYGYSAFTFRT